MKTIIFLVVLSLFIFSIYYIISLKGRCKTPKCESKDNRVEGIQRAQKNLHPHYNKNVDRGASGRFKRKA